MLIQSMQNEKSTSNNDLSSLLNNIFVDETEGYFRPIKINQYEKVWTPNCTYVWFGYVPHKIIYHILGQLSVSINDYTIYMNKQANNKKW